MSSAQEAHFACEKCALAIHLEGRSLKLAGSNAAVGTALITCCVRATCERLQRRDGGGATRVGRCGEGDSGSQRPKSVAPPRDEMTASSRRRRWCHRREAAPTALQMDGKFPGSASGEPRRQAGVHSRKKVRSRLQHKLADARVKQRTLRVRPKKPGRGWRRCPRLSLVFAGEALEASGVARDRRSRRIGLHLGSMQLRAPLHAHRIARAHLTVGLL